MSDLDYQPEVAPTPKAWLALNEQERIAAAMAAHEGRFPDALHTERSNPMMHGALHAIVETQIASRSPAITGQTVGRLMRDGLKRHPAVHMVMQVLAEQLVQASEGGTDPAWFAQRLSALKAGDAVAEALRGQVFRDSLDEDGAEPQNRAQRRAAKKAAKKRGPSKS